MVQAGLQAKVLLKTCLFFDGVKVITLILHHSLLHGITFVFSSKSIRALYLVDTQRLIDYGYESKSS